jgi:16S rRNA C967 or C1407 C5-methylase (RsmB/RsmF family)
MPKRKKSVTHPSPTTVPSATAPSSGAPPSRLLLKLSQRLFTQATEQAQFAAALSPAAGSTSTPRSLGSSLLWLKPLPDVTLFASYPPLAWQPEFVERLHPEQRPGQHPAHASGDYYCLDFSSVFAAAPLLTLPHQPRRVIDCCAAPGGKSVLAWRMLQPQWLMCNEVIGKRLGMLISNLQRCRIHPAVVMREDVAVLAEHLPGAANLVLVDAPCSGQSLLAKGEKAEGCFHPVTIAHNAKRQKRILANAVALLAPQAYLLYTTCTFSFEENEQVSEWLHLKFPQLQPVIIPFLQDFQSHLTTLPCYRLWPQSGLGAGAFTILWQNTNRHTIDSGDKPVGQADLDSAWLEQAVRWRSPQSLLTLGQLDLLEPN